MTRIPVLTALLAGSVFAAQPLVVISVDGLDNRYLAEADQRGLKIPTLRKLMREGQYSQGVIGVVPTITWPSHTTILTGVDPVVHGILSNWRPPGDRYLDYAQIRSPNLIGAAQLRTMKPTALLINTARGGLVDEQALIRALEEKWIAGAGFDVLTVEPPTRGHPLLEVRRPNFILTPHVAWASEGAMQFLADQLIDNIEAFAGGKPQHLVT